MNTFRIAKADPFKVKMIDKIEMIVLLIEDRDFFSLDFLGFDFLDFFDIDTPFEKIISQFLEFVKEKTIMKKVNVKVNVGGIIG